MAETLDRSSSDSDLRGRLRGSVTHTQRRPVPHYTSARRINDFRYSAPPIPLKKNIQTHKSVKVVSEFIAPSTTKTINQKQVPVSSLVRKHTATNPGQPRQNRSVVLRRQQVQQAHKSKKRFAISRSTAILWSMAAVIFITGIVVAAMSVRTNKTALAQVAQLAQKNTEGGETPNEVPSEDPPKGDINNYQVAPDLPRFISIPKFNVKARVQRLGVKVNNELKAPANIFDTGWYEGSAKPGDYGAVLIDGHVSGPTTSGVFYNLKNLKAGDSITITKGDGQVLQYKVVTSKSTPASQTDMAAALKPVEGKRGLNLITCGGKFNKDLNTYEDRLIVFATQVE